MLEIKELPIQDFEKVIEIIDSSVGLHAFIAIHSTKLGPSLGGARFFPYPDSQSALIDVLRLAKAMSYKSALIMDGLGGGKSVIIGNPHKEKSKELLLSFGKALNYLEGKYIVAEDVGTTTEDMDLIRQVSPYVAACSTCSSSGDPSPFTAWGVLLGMRAALQFLDGNPSLTGRRIAIQGLGNVGFKLAQFLFWEGANLIVCDPDASKTENAKNRFDAEVVQLNEIYDVSCDIFSPCALGGILNSQTIPRLKCKAIAGSANNQLLDEKDGYLIAERGILYAPDYVINAGGLINVSIEFEPNGYNAKIARKKVLQIYNTLLTTFQNAGKEKKATNLIADEAALYRLNNGIGARTTPIKFNK